MNHVVADDFKAGVGKKMSDVALRTGEEIVQADDIGAGTDQAVTQVASQEACPAGDHNSFRRHADHPGWDDEVRVSENGTRFVWNPRHAPLTHETKTRGKERIILTIFTLHRGPCRPTAGCSETVPGSSGTVRWRHAGGVCCGGRADR